MEPQEILLLAVAHFVGCPDMRNDGIPNTKLATRIWSFLEIPSSEFDAVRRFGPGMPDRDAAITMQRELTFHQLVCCCKAYASKLGRLQCCRCNRTQSPSQFHRLYTRGDLGEWYYVCRETRLHHVVRRGAQEPQADLARGYICRRGFLQPGGSASSSGGFGGSDPCVSTKVLWSPCVGCDVCEEVFREHPQCQSCRLGTKPFLSR